MADEKAASPEKDNLQTVETPAKDGTILTGKEPEKGTSPLAKGATPELPHLWMNGLTTEQKADADLVKSLSKFEKGIPDLAKSYAELEKKLSQTPVIPNDKATPEEWAAYRKAIGVPEKSEDYKLEKVQLPEWTGGVAKESVDKFLALAHKLNMTNDQVKSIHSWYYKNLVDEMKIVKTTQDECSAIMAKEFGSDWDERQTYLDRAFVRFGNKEVSELFAHSGLGNHPGVVRMFINIGKLIGDHKFVEGRGEKTETDAAHILYPDLP